MKTSSLIATAVFALASGFSALAIAGTNISLVYNGVAYPNMHAAPTIQAYADWCATGTQGCIPTVQQTIYDTRTGAARGTVYVWATLPFNAGTVIPSSFCFSEFMMFELEGGVIYTHSADVTGTCGATIDPVLKPPIHTDLGATSVIAGGGDGVIVGGTKRFRNVTGTFTDRVFVGFGAPTSGVGGIIYYDQLWFDLFLD